MSFSEDDEQNSWLVRVFVKRFHYFVSESSKREYEIDSSKHSC